MKLYFSPTSPFVRKVMVAAHERGIAGDIECVSDLDDLHARNPLAKVPTLVTADGQVLYDSLVIVSWLDARGSGPDLIPDEAPLRDKVLCRHALADGIMEAAVASVMETRRPAEKQWQGFLDHQRGKIERGIATLAGVDPGSVVDIATISAAAALGYVTFRLPAIDWRSAHPDLALWYDTFAERPSMTATVPRNP